MIFLRWRKDLGEEETIEVLDELDKDPGDDDTTEEDEKT